MASQVSQSLSYITDVTCTCTAPAPSTKAIQDAHIYVSLMKPGYRYVIPTEKDKMCEFVDEMDRTALRTNLLLFGQDGKQVKQVHAPVPTILSVADLGAPRNFDIDPDEIPRGLDLTSSPQPDLLSLSTSDDGVLTLPPPAPPLQDKLLLLSAPIQWRDPMVTIWISRCVSRFFSSYGVLFEESIRGIPAANMPALGVEDERVDLVFVERMVSEWRERYGSGPPGDEDEDELKGVSMRKVKMKKGGEVKKSMRSIKLQRSELLESARTFAALVANSGLSTTAPESHLPSPVELNLKFPYPSPQLLEAILPSLEAIHRIVSCYMWMHYRKPVAFWDVGSVERWRQSAERGLEWVLGKRKALESELELKHICVNDAKASNPVGDNMMWKNAIEGERYDVDEKVELGLGPATELMKIEVKKVVM
jgi:hypothetical protein